MVYRTIHFPDGGEGGVYHNCHMGVATTRGFEHKHDVSTGGCVAQSREGRSCTRLSNGLAEIPGRSAFLSQSQWV